VLRKKDAARKRVSGFVALLLMLGLLAPLASAQNNPAAKSPVPARAARQASGADADAPPAADNEASVAAVRDQLMTLLRMSPKLSNFVARDASLLADQDYVARNNPELAKFLARHPEVTANPDFYLFAEVGGRGRGQRFERRDWQWESYRRSPVEEVLGYVVPFSAFVIILGALVWLLRVLMENRRWNRVFRNQTEVNNKLLDKFSNSEELLAYMRSDAGKRFLEAAPVSFAFETGQRMSGAVARVFTPLQLGVVLALVGGGFYSLRGQVSEGSDALLVFGTITLTLGIGFIISAVVSWFLARHLGLLPKNAAQNGNGHDQPQLP
jgi:hypothetical protein